MMNIKENYHYLYLLISILLVCLIRFNLLDIPLERDEGEYGYMGQLILQGIPPYKYAYNMKLPGAYFIYALILKIFGETIRGIHIGFLCINLLNVTGIYFLIKKLLNARSAFFASISFGVYSASPYVLGFAFHATHLVFLFFVYGIILLMRGLESRKNLYVLIAGIFFGFSFLMKQQAIFLLAFSFFYLCITQLFLEKEKRTHFFLKLFYLGTGVALPIGAVCVYLYSQNVFSEFWFWTFEYASKYVGLISASQGLRNLVSSTLELYKGFEVYWILSPIGFFLIPLLNLPKEKKTVLYGLFLFSFMTTVPGLYFRGHYFIPFLPFLLVFASIPFYFIEEKISNKYVLIIGLLVLLFGIRNAIQQNKSYFFKHSPIQNSRIIYFISPFPEAVKIAEYIATHSNSTDTITVFGSEPEIYFYANRKSTTGFIYLYPLMEDHKFSLELQKKMVMELNEKKPNFVVLINNELEYFQNNSSKQNLVILFNWLEAFKKQSNYKKVGIAELLIDGTKYTFDKDLSNHKYTSKVTIDLYQKME